ncbi:HlyD family efflux transporter periplasmic adaptor subunit [Acidovorax sp. DW039]|nr:HlyD family efflux transporter periplasmic adaptor subunit [Acidovorax sp. DW039]
MLAGIVILVATIFASNYLFGALRKVETIQGETTIIKIGSTNQSFEFSGKLISGNITDVTAPFDAYIKAKNFRFGEKKGPGEVLVELSLTELDDQIKLAKANLLKSKKELDEIRNWKDGIDASRMRSTISILQRAQKKGEEKLLESQRLFDLGIIPRNELEEIYNQNQQIRDQLDSANYDLSYNLQKSKGVDAALAETNFTLAKIKVDELNELASQQKITSHSNVLIGEIPNKPGESFNVEVGRFVKRGESLFRLHSLDGLEIRGFVAEDEHQKIQIGQPANVKFISTTKKTYSGIVSSFSRLPSGDTAHSEEANRYEIRIKLENFSDEIPQGASALVHILLEKNKTGLVLPIKFIQNEYSGEMSITYVTKIKADGGEEKIFIKAKTIDTEMAEVIGDLKEGDKIIHKKFDY